MQFDNGSGSQSWTFNSNGTGRLTSTIDMDYSWANGTFDYTIAYYDAGSKLGNFKYTFTSGKSKGKSYNKTFQINGNSINIDGMTYRK